MHKISPLILTLHIDDGAQKFFDDLRETYFPSDRNFIKAHLALFHHLPTNKQVWQDLENWSANHSSIPLQVSEIKSIGKGVAYKIESQELVQLHQTMQARWRIWLKPQDKQRIWPHITIQNKVSADEAKDTLALLQQTFTPFETMGLGFDLWSYENGPWKFIQHFAFEQKER